MTISTKAYCVVVESQFHIEVVLGPFAHQDQAETVRRSYYLRGYNAHVAPLEGP